MKYPEEVLITVTEEDLRESKRIHQEGAQRSSGCPVSLAACRALGLELGQVKVGYTELYVGTDDVERYIIPVEGTLAIQEFDGALGSNTQVPEVTLPLIMTIRKESP